MDRKPIKEKALQLGDSKSLAAILTEAAPVRCDIAYVLLNAGIIHRVGPHRLTVKLARALAANGIPSIRFDISGLGDSPPRVDGQPYQQSRFSEAAQVMDYLENKFGIGRFVTLGLCSGADHAFRLAVRDHRVVGAVMLDGYTYRTRSFHLRRFARGAMRWQSWWRLAKRAGRTLARSFSSGEPGSLSPLAASFVMDVPPQHQAAAMLAELVARDKRLLFTYSGGVSDTFNHKGQFRDMFPSVDIDSIRVEYWPDMDHTATRLSHQQRLIDTVVNWSLGSFAAAKVVA